MTPFNAFILGCGLLLAAASILAVRRPLPSRVVSLLIILSFASSAASALVVREREAGTGSLHARGYPTPFVMRWRDFDGTQGPRRVETIPFAANTTAHGGVLALVAAVWPRRRIDPSTMPPLMRVVVRISLGILFLILGVIGSLLPVLQGWIFFLIAFLLLFPKTRLAEKIISKVEPKMPRMAGFLRRMGIGTREFETPP